MHRKIAVTVAAVLVLGNPNVGLAQGTGGTPGGQAPGTGASGPAPTPGTGIGGAPAPGIGTSGSPNSGTLPSNPSGTASGTPPNVGQTQDADIKAEYLEAIPYKPCPANVRFPNGRQECLGLPGYPDSRHRWYDPNE
jgi:hypothetical protein